MKKRNKRLVVVTHYTHWDELMASPSQPMPDTKMVHHLTVLWSGLASLEKADAPTVDDWRVCSDAVNMLETLTTEGGWLGCDGKAVQLTDESGLIEDAIDALAKAGMRARQGQAIRLDGAGIKAIRSVLENYAELIEVLPHRTMVRCHRLTEIKIKSLLMKKDPSLTVV